jgi:hypothetical protein
LVFPLLLGAICWFLPLPITNTIIKGEPLVEDNAMFFPELERVAITVMGLYLLYRGLSDLAYNYAHDAELVELLGREHERKAGRYAAFFSTYVEIGVSILFIFGARTIVTSLRKAWAFGRRWPPVS